MFLNSIKSLASHKWKTSPNLADLFHFSASSARCTLAQPQTADDETKKFQMKCVHFGLSKTATFSFSMETLGTFDSDEFAQL